MTSWQHWRNGKQKGLPLAIGSRVGLVTVIAEAPSLGTGLRVRVCCDCGTERVERSADLRRKPPQDHRRCAERAEKQPVAPNGDSA